MDQTITDETCTPAQVPGQSLSEEAPEAPLVVPQSGTRGEGASEPQWGSHPINIRLTIPLLFESCYVTIVAGRERRSPERRASERKKHPLLTLGNVIVALVASTICALAAVALIHQLTLYTLDTAGGGIGISMGLLLYLAVLSILLWLWQRHRGRRLR